MWTDETTLRERFSDIDQLAQQCRFHDCKHGTDTGCAIRTALTEGRLDPERYEGYLKLDDEIEELRHNRKKRQMTIERRFKRDQHIKAKKFAARQERDEE
jgi:ribosome biogenesis GTPase